MAEAECLQNLLAQGFLPVVCRLVISRLSDLRALGCCFVGGHIVFLGWSGICPVYLLFEIEKDDNV